MRDILDFLKTEKIDRFAFCDFSKARVINPVKLERLEKLWGKAPQTVMVFLAPYSVGTDEPGNISLYARSRDYHLYFGGFFDRLGEYLGPDGASDFAGFSDNSPVDEVDLAVRSGLGVRGDNSLLIDRTYGSFIFIGEIFFRTDPGYPLSEMDRSGECLHCGRCKKACPVGCVGTKDRSLCLSYLSQKKRLEEHEEELLVRHGVLWGCDECQLCCPMNKSAKKTPLEFFSSDRVPFLTDETLDEIVSGGTFADRAFSWRGENVLRRNLNLTKRS
ncbi:MAG: epoxyqueuosine reductase [Clostridia bacterium]|nr:epoxyqueuosine reductase [Clostridia bacterium]